jgi:Acetyl-coenzyme A synthetase N-terminus
MAMELIKDQNDYQKAYKQSIETPEQFWAHMASTRLVTFSAVD